MRQIQEIPLFVDLCATQSCMILGNYTLQDQPLAQEQFKRDSQLQVMSLNIEVMKLHHVCNILLNDESKM